MGGSSDLEVSQGGNAGSNPVGATHLTRPFPPGDGLVCFVWHGFAACRAPERVHNVLQLGQDAHSI
jgi:hypothetical protein